MILGAYALRDIKLAAFMPPLFVRTEAQAVRLCTDLVNDSQSEQSRHSDDYALFCVGSYDDVTGELVAIGGSPRFVVELSSLRRSE
jgi:hypothetical protein